MLYALGASIFSKLVSIHISYVALTNSNHLAYESFSLEFVTSKRQFNAIDAYNFFGGRGRG